MFALKRMAFTVFILGNSALSAGTVGTMVCSPETVSLSCSHAAWNITAQALYLQTNFNQAFSYYPRGENGIFNDLGGQWGWGLYLGGTYHFNSANDVTLNWYHLQGKTSHFKFNPLGEFDPLRLRLALKNQWDAVNGELAQSINLHRDVRYRFHGGFQYAYIKNTMDAKLSIMSVGSILGGESAAEDIAGHLAYATEYNGLGPRTGIDMDYILGRGFSMYIKAATALLIGTAKNQINGFSAQNTDATSFMSSFTAVRGSRTAIVPELEAKVGLNYFYPTARGDLTFDLGYMWINYFNPLANQYIIDNIENNQSITRENKATDLSLSGVYFGMKYLVNI